MTPHKLSARIDKAKQSLTRNDPTELLELIDEAPSTLLLQYIREQKLLYRLKDSSVRDVLCDRLAQLATQLTPQGVDAHYAHYLQFVRLTAKLFDDLSQQAAEHIRAFPKLHLDELLWIAQQVLEFLVQEDPAAPRMGLPTNGSIGDRVAQSERDLHEYSGRINEIYAAVARAINELSRGLTTKSTPGAGARVRAAAVEKFVSLIELASKWNAIDFAVDNVAYGEWYVAEITVAASPLIKLEYVDMQGSLLRLLAIRRRMSMILGRLRPTRNIARYFVPMSTIVVNEAVRHYQRLYQRDVVSQPDLVRCVSDAQRLLDFLDAEDDMLSIVDDAQEQGGAALHYMVAAFLHWYAQAANLVKKALPERLAKGAPIPKVAIDVLTNTIARHDPQQLPLAAQAVRTLTLSLPADRHIDLVKIPFILGRDGHIRSLPTSDRSHWNINVREALIKGGERGRKLGALWEEDIAKEMAKGGWKLIGKGVKLRVDGRIITDVDLLLLKGDLLLIAQVKAMIGSGVTPYDHWKARTIIEMGCHQARLAVNVLAEDLANPDRPRLSSLCNRKLAKTIQHVEPVVLTNVFTVNGWIYQGIPVGGWGTINAITKGARVEYRRYGGEKVEVREFVAKENLTTEKIRWLLRNPVDLLVAHETGEVLHQTTLLDGVTWTIPTFTIRPDLSRVPEAPPGG